MMADLPCDQIMVQIRLTISCRKVILLIQKCFGRQHLLFFIIIYKHSI